jgi:hypothetical protein
MVSIGQGSFDTGHTAVRLTSTTPRRGVMIPYRAD